jgi:uncharacterized protein (DUF1800 family)
MIGKLTAALLVCAGLVAAGTPAVPEDDQAATHALNRLAYGPRPGDVEAVRGMGVAAWIERQLHPERISDAALDARLAPLTTLTLDAATIVRDYDRPAVAERRQRQRAKADAPDATTASTTDAPGDDTRPALTPAQQKLRSVLAELEDAKILRAVYSERQLEAVLVDVWFNHFNVFAGKGPTRSYVTEYERDVIRPHVLGRFRELLGATAKSPAMLFYLDNWRNVDRGLNENYARELLELHTVGVDGGYTQQDIVHVARAFTGWTMRPREGSGFRFVAALHDRGPKTVLGHAIRAGGGIDDGEQVLDLLAAHPRTAHRVATTLAQRFVSDTPPPALVERAAARFLATHGDLREVVRTIVTSPEFFAPATAHAKLKTPFEFVASALRAATADVRNARPLARTLRELGMPLYFCQPPTGYADTAEAWASAGALVSRVNFALALGTNRVPGSRMPTGEAARDVSATIGLPVFQQR